MRFNSRDIYKKLQKISTLRYFLTLYGPVLVISFMFLAVWLLLHLPFALIIGVYQDYAVGFGVVWLIGLTFGTYMNIHLIWNWKSIISEQDPDQDKWIMEWYTSLPKHTIVRLLLPMAFAAAFIASCNLIAYGLKFIVVLLAPDPTPNNDTILLGGTLAISLIAALVGIVLHTKYISEFPEQLKNA